MKPKPFPSISVTEAARRAGRCRRTIFRWIEKKRFAYRQLPNSRIDINEESFDAFLGRFTVPARKVA